MSDLMTFPKTWEEFERSYGFTDKDKVYTNGARLIPSFRVEQWLEHMETQTVDAERHGHWLTFGSMHSCSICGETVLVPTTITGIPTYGYCPNCGAKMDESTMGQVKPSDRERKEDV